MKRIVLACSLALSTTPVFAQTLEELGLQTKSDRFDTLGEPNELDALSERLDDPFSNFAARSERQPVNVTVRTLNKVTAKYEDITIDMDEGASFGTLEIVARYCDKRPPEEFPETTAFLEIYDRGHDGSVVKAPIVPAASESPASLRRTKIDNPSAPVDAALDLDDRDTDDTGFKAEVLLPPPPEESVFSGWMFASSPALNALEHPVYDVWVIDCQTVALDGRDASSASGISER
ncbi:MAG: DUF2155 domain-containing protein [Pseudomonadota bacterium]